MNLDKTSVLIGLVHVLIGSVIQFYARPYQLRLSHYTIQLFILIFVLVLFLSGYFAQNLYEKRDYRAKQRNS
jgi:vacuolar-type H+-ATPase subunit I/STV1